MVESRARYSVCRSQLKDGSQSEKAFSQQVCDYARLHGWKVQRHWTERFSPAGWPDLTIARPASYPPDTRMPRLLFAELKSCASIVTPEQHAWIDALRAAGQAVFVWRPTPADWTEIEQVLGGQAG